MRRAGRLERMSGASDKCAEQCWRSDDDEEEGEYAANARAKRRKAQMHWSARGAGSKHWEIEGLMVWL